MARSDVSNLRSQNPRVPVPEVEGTVKVAYVMMSHIKGCVHTHAQNATCSTLNNCQSY